MVQETNDKSTDETPKIRLVALVLPILGVCWLAFMAFPGFLGKETTIDYAAMVLGVGLMVAGAFRFLYSPTETGADE